MVHCASHATACVRAARGHCSCIRRCATACVRAARGHCSCIRRCVAFYASCPRVCTRRLCPCPCLASPTNGTHCLVLHGAARCLFCRRYPRPAGAPAEWKKVAKMQKGATLLLVTPQPKGVLEGWNYVLQLSGKKRDIHADLKYQNNSDGTVQVSDPSTKQCDSLPSG